MMTRGLGFLTMGTLFLLISPNIRQSGLGVIGSIDHQFELYAPYSYVAGAVLVLLILMMSFYRGAQPQ